MPLINLTMSGTAANVAAALASVANAVTTSGAVIQGQIRVNVNVTVLDFPSVANATLTITAALTVNNFNVLSTLKTALAAVKAANPNVSFTLDYAEEQTV